MTYRRMIYCTISIVLSLCALTVFSRYAEKDYKMLALLAIPLIVKLNIYMFTPKKVNAI